MNIYLLKDFIDEIIQNKEKYGATVWLNKTPNLSNWRDNHELCIANYERMKESRKRIIKQRDNLQTKIQQMQKRINHLEKYSKLKNENTSLETTVRNQTSTIQTLKIQNEHLRREKEEYQRRYNLIQQITEGKL